VLIFLSLVAFIFWLGGLAERAAHKEPASRGVSVPPGVTVTRPASAPVTGD
jgi:hypothetical protein